MAILIPSIEALTIPAPPPLPPELQSYEWAAYGTLVQDLIDRKIKDFTAYYTPLAIVQAELQIEKDRIFRQYHRTRREMLRAEGVKGNVLMPGYLQRKLMDLSLDEKRDLSEAALKIAATHADASLDAVYTACGQGVQSEGLRSSMHIEIQAASYDVAKAALFASYEATKQRIVQYSASLKVIETQFSLIEIEYNAMAQAVEAEIYAVKIEIEQAQNIGNVERLQELAALLEVAYKEIEYAQSRIPIALKEIEKVQADMGVLEAERALAVFKELTARASMEKSQARLQEIEVTRRKIDLELAKVGLQVQRNEAETESELSSIAARRSEETITNARETIQLMNTEADAELTGIKADIDIMEIGAANERTNYYQQRGAELTLRYTLRGVERTMALRSRAMTQVTMIGFATQSRVSNINQEATNTLTAIAAAQGTTVADLAARTAVAIANIQTLTANQKTFLADMLAQRILNLDIRLAAKQGEFGLLKNTALSEYQMDTSQLQTETNARKAIMVAEQAAISFKTLDQILALEEKFNEWKKSYEDSVKNEAKSMVEAAKAAANADVSSEFHYTEG